MNGNKQSESPSKPITLYNAVDRYQMVARELTGIERDVEDLKDCAHPGVFDVFIHFSMLKSAVEGATGIFEAAKLQKITPKNIRMLSNLEVLVLELREIVKDAREELLPE